jgi:hypothetical protein
MFDPARDPEWISVIRGVELVDPSLEPGARVKRTAQVFGHDLSWTTEVEAVHFPHVLSLRIVEGPVTGTVRYDIQRAGAGSRVRVRAVGESSLLAGLPSMLITGPVKAALAADLGRLKALVEQTR